MARTLDAIDTQLNEIAARMNQLDGMHLSDPAKSTVNQIMKEINGLRTTLNQAVLGMEADRQQLRDDLDALTVLVQQHLSASA